MTKRQGASFSVRLHILYITANDIYMTTEVGFSKFRKIKVGKEATAPLKGAHI